MGLRQLLLVVPAAAAMVAAYALLGPGARRDIDGARVYAAPAEDGSITSGRVTVARASTTGEAPLAGVVTLTLDGQETRVAVSADGVGEFVLPAPSTLGSTASIRSDAGRTLAIGPIARAHVAEDANDHALELGEWGSSTGDLVIAPHLERGTLVPTFSSDVVVELRDRAGQPVEGRLDVEVVGAECPACGKPIEHASSARLSLTPSLDVVSITMDARAPDGRKGHAYAEIPAQMGGLFLGASTPEELIVSAPTQRRYAYASLFRAGHRIGGASSPLTEDEYGRFSATLLVDAPGADLAVLTTDAEEGGGSTVWALRPAATKRRLTAPRLVNLLDGFPQLKAVEARRVGWVYRILFLTVGALALLEIVLLGVVARSTRKELTTHFEEAREDEDIVLRPAPPIEPARSSALVIVTVGLVVVVASAAMVGLAFVRG
ncbi:MAG: hypothetical protein U0414_28965 [Polyangiaceae bacterium]